MYFSKIYFHGSTQNPSRLLFFGRILGRPIFIEQDCDYTHNSTICKRENVEEWAEWCIVTCSRQIRERKLKQADAMFMSRIVYITVVYKRNM